MVRPGFHWTTSLLAQSAASGKRLAYDLYIDLPWVEEAAKGQVKEAVEGFFAKIDNMPRPNRLFVPAFQHGHTFFPPKDLPFALDRRCQGLNLLREFSHRAIFERRLVVYGIADLLRWAAPNTPKEDDPFTRYPEWLEVNIENACNQAHDGKFASPFHPQVWQALIALAQALARQYPPLHGLLIQCRLSLRDLLGYSEAARAAYIRAYQVDPVDLDQSLRDSKNPVSIGHWAVWRRRVITDLVGAVSRTFRAGRVQARVAVRGIAPYYSKVFSPTQRLMARQDWLEWLNAGHADEVILHANWLDNRNQTWLKDGMTALKRAKNQRVYVNPLIICREGSKVVSLQEQWVRLEQQVVWPYVVIAIQHPNDLERVQQFLQSL
ncbi:MAG: family 10 glycosylhydrolase [Abditibacteriales bacterium]|nr:family 10 glycosylhydrolase [Abditibacteriales bacterium]MDW8367633.1 family 10 glycosylhydrolase [Abditibacteriales bacterium]